MEATLRSRAVADKLIDPLLGFIGVPVFSPQLIDNTCRAMAAFLPLRACHSPSGSSMIVKKKCLIALITSMNW